MSTVTGRIKQVEQPIEGFAPPSTFEVTQYDDKLFLNESENIHPNVVGMTVDYMTRAQLGVPLIEAFHISLLGWKNAKLYENYEHNLGGAEKLLKDIHGLSDKAIMSAYGMACYDVWYRNPIAARKEPILVPDKKTIDNMRIMIKRSLNFFQQHGPVIKTEFTFEGGYTPTVCAGGGDYLTKDTLWDMKVSKNKINKKQTLQLLMYWIMGQHSGKPEFKDVKKVGIFNPRLNTKYVLAMSEIPEYYIREIEKRVICYE